MARVLVLALVVCSVFHYSVPLFFNADVVSDDRWLQLVNECAHSEECMRIPELCSTTECEALLMWKTLGLPGEREYTVYGNAEKTIETTVKFIYENHPESNDAFTCHSQSEETFYQCSFTRPLQAEPKPTIKLHSQISQPELLKRSRRSLDEDYSAGCGVTKGCFSQAGNLFTYVMLQDIDGTEYIRIQLLSQIERDWVAIGFSNDRFMPDTSVVECQKKENGSIVVQHSYNPDYFNEVIDSRGLLVLEAGVVSNSIKCSFDRKVVYGGEEADPRIFNLTKEYYLLLASGPYKATDPNAKGKHLGPPPVPSPLTNLSEFSVSSAPSSNSDMCGPCTVRAHGCLMITAWMFLTSLGIFIARYFKPFFTHSDKLKTAIWFFAHRALMILTWCCTAAAFIIIFVLKNGNLTEFGSTSPSYYNAHAPIGITVMILASINPIMALFRCAPDHDKRPIFNWLHRTVGTCAQLLGIINIFFGIEMAQSFGTIGGTVFWLMVAYVAFHVCIEAVLLTIHLSSRAAVRDGKAKRFRVPNFSLFGFYALVVGGLWIAMVVLISLG